MKSCLNCQINSLQILQTAAHRQEEARLATLRALEDSCVAGDLAAVRAVVSPMDPSAATALVNHAASGRNTLLFKVGESDVGILSE